MMDEAGASSGAVGAQVSAILGDQRVDLVYGTSNAQLNIPMTVDTIVQVGSVTKVLNAAIAMSLVDEGKLELDTPIVSYLPELEVADRHARETITLRQLLSMSSGLDNAVPYVQHGRAEDALARYVASLHEVRQVFAPGKGFGYSNAGSCIVGRAAERLTGELWDTLLRQRILEPAGLVHAESLAEELPFHRVSVGHGPALGEQPPTVTRPWCLTRAQGPAGSTLAMSAHDTASFGRLFVSGGIAANGNRVLSESTIKAMMTPTTDVPIAVPKWGIGSKWGLGPNLSHWDGTAVWGHVGGNTSGACQLVWFPQKCGVLAFTVNTLAAFDMFTARMFDDFSRAVFGVGMSRLRAPESPLEVEQPTRFAGTYTRCGARYEVSEESGRLHYTERNLGLGVPGEILGIAVEGDLTSLGEARFLVMMPGFTDGIPVAFFGSDERGRACNVVTPMFAARRVD